VLIVAVTANSTMGASLLSWLIFSGATLVQCTSELPALDNDLINQVNSQDVGWTAGRNDKFEAMTLEEAKYLLGTLSSPGESTSVHNRSGDSYNSGSVPVNFDTRTQWPSCIHAIRDQGHCGGCWAFAASEVLSDRLCIASKGAENLVLSPQDLMSCDISKYTMGCDGGVPEYAWKYLESTGISTEACVPFLGNKTEACPTTCNGTSSTGASSVKTYKVVPGSSRLVIGATGVGAVQQDMYANGPVQTAMLVYQDFFAYKSGIYRHSPNAKFLGKHSVKFVGYGVDEGVAYWIVANSWGPTWGDKGFFRIARGWGESGIENEMVYGQALVSEVIV